MREVRVRKDESIESALRRFKRLCRDDLKELKKRRHYIKPSDSRKRRKARKKSGKDQ